MLGLHGTSRITELFTCFLVAISHIYQALQSIVAPASTMSPTCVPCFVCISTKSYNLAWYLVMLLKRANLSEVHHTSPELYLDSEFVVTVGQFDYEKPPCTFVACLVKLCLY